MNCRKLFRRGLPLFLVFMIIIVIVGVIRSFKLPDMGRQPVVGVVLVGSRMDKGWNENHFNGISEACNEQGCKILVRENVMEEELPLSKAVEGLVDDGADVVFLTSFGYGQYSDSLARRYSSVAFFSVSGQGTERNCNTYFARLYQARYLAGIVAGCESRTGILGYVAAMPNAQTNRGINAYALGMRRANPKARLIVRFTGNWDNEEKERESVALLKQRGVDVITYHEDKPYAVREAEARGMFSVGYNSVHEQYSERFLTAALYDWKVIYGRVLEDYLSGRTNMSRNYWIDMSGGGVRLHRLSPLVRGSTISLLEQEESRFTNNWDVFSGRIYDNEGTLRCADDERISDQELFTGMEWFAEGVEIYEQ